MKTSMLGFTVGACLIAAVWAVMAFSQDRQARRTDLDRLKLFTYSTGLTGFFDPATGLMYIYDFNVENLVMVRQLGVLGAPITKIADYGLR